MRRCHAGVRCVQTKSDMHTYACKYLHMCNNGTHSHTTVGGYAFYQCLGKGKDAALAALEAAEAESRRRAEEGTRPLTGVYVCVCEDACISWVMSCLAGRNPLALGDRH